MYERGETEFSILLIDNPNMCFDRKPLLHPACPFFKVMAEATHSTNSAPWGTVEKATGGSD